MEFIEYIILPRVQRITKSLTIFFCNFQLNTEWAQVEVINLINDGSGLGFGIIGGRSTGVVVKTILPGGVADRVSVIPRIKLSLRRVLITKMGLDKLDTKILFERKLHLINCDDFGPFSQLYM